MNRSNYEYKESGIEWLGEVPEEWAVLKLKYSSDVTMGQSPSSDDYSDDSDMLPFLQGNADFNARYPIPRVYCDSANKIIPKGSVLISVRAPVGAINEADQNYGIGRGLCALVPKSNLLKEYAWYQLHVTRLELNSLATGSTYDAVSVDEVADMSILVPSFFEQQAIATFLDRETARIDALIQKKERMTELLKEKRIALITQAITKGLDPNVPMKDSGIEWLGEVPEHWGVKRIKHIARRIQTGCTPPTSNEQHYEDGTLQWFGPSSFTEDLYLTDPVKIINESSISDGVARLFEKGSIMMVGIGATIGKIAQITMPSSCNQQITVITLKESECCPDYYTYLLKIMETTIRGIAPSATLAIFDQGKIGNLSILQPPLHEQWHIAEYLSVQLSDLTHMISLIVSSLSLLREYRASLIHHAVTGKIDLRGYDAQA